MRVQPATWSCSESDTIKYSLGCYFDVCTVVTEKSKKHNIGMSGVNNESHRASMQEFNALRQALSNPAIYAMNNEPSAAERERVKAMLLAAKANAKPGQVSLTLLGHGGGYNIKTGKMEQPMFVYVFASNIDDAVRDYFKVFPERGR